MSVRLKCADSWMLTKKANDMDTDNDDNCREEERLSLEELTAGIMSDGRSKRLKDQAVLFKRMENRG